MLKRLVVGLLKGLVLGAAIGAGIQYGLHSATGGPLLVTSGGLLGYLLAMGTSGTTGVFAGKPPWREGAWIEALLKGLVGVGIGALLYWLGSAYGAVQLPFPGVGSAAWTALPVIFLPAIAGVYGSLVELDNSDDGGAKKGSGGGKGETRGPRARVAVDDDDALGATEHAASTRPARRRI
ncbi:hypothetical protein [Sandaracinus amylolyticus]|uniref:Uncharacterized protein n=1 Tax=Sandaracinus amylolyticus TaxID=927083 RepID=A0A0F6W885_9BACT|nr:hypothetical protein [Sandaracinus amylolyticus]AKF09808.1 hypothetical protein DB32_006957 [Sandaracinus amylolyticus]